MSDVEATVYEAVGGMPFFERLVGDFYTGVQGDRSSRMTGGYGNGMDLPLFDAAARLSAKCSQPGPGCGEKA